MLARSHGPRLDHNAENPGAFQHHKTPARPIAGKGAAPQAGPDTVGKGALLNTAWSGRVLGAKDRNLGKGEQDSTGLLFPGGKPSTSQAQAGPSSCAPRPVRQQAFKTPLPNKTLRQLAPQDLRTPATALRPKRAPLRELDSPDVSIDADVNEQPKEPEEEEDREVEYAGASARDYDEPYIPDWDEPDYKTAGYGDMLRSLPFGRFIDVEEALRQDQVELDSYRATLDEEIPPPPCLLDSEADQPIFPLPKTRAPLAAQPSTARPVQVPRGTSTGALGRSAPGSSTSRTPLGASGGSVRLQGSNAAPGSRPRPQAAAPSLIRSTLVKQSGQQQASASSMRPPAGAAPIRKPLATSSSSARPGAPVRPRLAPTGSARGLSSPAGSTLRSNVMSPAQLAAKRQADLEAAERELGAFGLADRDEGGLEVLLSGFEGDGLSQRGFGDESTGAGEAGEFRLSLDL
ncbi:hypothetical protein BMF94_5856 [Rhodotorula taiwanensis]|uniref:Uncharacterized protein n=1 Tax=Rhodotorula taiwanensis TaxID=741276 RepID=A0A2S5B2U7_9BASI|nr:hypothetical protein BMF94_5856 [Rhodotorula taiwanensis]